MADGNGTPTHGELCRRVESLEKQAEDRDERLREIESKVASLIGKSAIVVALITGAVLALLSLWLKPDV